MSGAIWPAWGTINPKTLTVLAKRLTIVAFCVPALIATGCGPAASPPATEPPIVEINGVTATPAVTLAATLAATRPPATSPATTPAPASDVPVRNAAAIRDVLLAVSQGDPWDQEKD